MLNESSFDYLKPAGPSFEDQEDELPPASSSTQPPSSTTKTSSSMKPPRSSTLTSKTRGGARSKNIGSNADSDTTAVQLSSHSKNPGIKEHKLDNSWGAAVDDVVNGWEAGAVVDTDLGPGGDTEQNQDQNQQTKPDLDPTSIPRSFRYWLHDDRGDLSQVGSGKRGRRGGKVAGGRGRGQWSAQGFADVAKYGADTRSVGGANNWSEHVPPRVDKWVHDRYEETLQPAPSVSARGRGSGIGNRSAENTTTGKRSGTREVASYF